MQRRIAELEGEGGAGLKQRADRLQGQLDESLRQLANRETELREAKEERKEAEKAWRTQLSAVQEEYDRQCAIAQELSHKLETLTDEQSERDRAEQSRMNRMNKIMRLQGRVWTSPPSRNHPRFLPLAERHAAIISVLNLKGGVGKTTVTAHLGAALSGKGYRVLLMDLDLQGSLSSLFMGESALVERSEARLLLQHFLLDAAERGRTKQHTRRKLRECCVPIFDGKSAIVPNADSMAYAELNLTMQWLLRLHRRDTRFLLRKALHQKQITSRYDVVLLDCPPLFNTCCVNALAASDYVLIPMVPSRKAAERVPLLLERLQSLHQIINPQLQVMGVLLNRTHSSHLTEKETDLWREVLERGQDRWRLPVPAFRTFIRQMVEVRELETEFSQPALGGELHTSFSALAAEVEERMPGDCRRTASVPVGPG